MVLIECEKATGLSAFTVHKHNDCSSVMELLKDVFFLNKYDQTCRVLFRILYLHPADTNW